MPAEAGSFYSTYRLDLTLFRQDMATAKSELAAFQQSQRQQLAQPLGASGGGGGGASATASGDAELRLAQARARLAQASGDTARAEQILSNALANTTGAGERASLSVQTQVARLQSGTGIVQQFGESFKSGLLGIVGPAAAAGAAIAAIKGTVDSFVEAFKFKTELDAQRAALTAQISGVRDIGQTYADAAKYADTYKLTQQETTDALQASIPILRTSKDSVQDVLGTLQRLTLLNPAENIAGAARALRELSAGQVVSIVDRFNISRTAANAMKKEIEGGADAIQVLSKYLDTAGASMDALKARTTGAAGAMRDAARAEEQLKLAEAEWAQGPGVALIEGRVQATRSLITVMDLLSGRYDQAAEAAQAAGQQFEQSGSRGAGAAAGWARYAQAVGQASSATQQHAAIAQISTQTINLQSTAMVTSAQAGIYQSSAMIQAGNAQAAYNQQVYTANAALQESANATQIDTANKQADTAQTALLQAQTQAAVNAFLALNPNISASGVAALQAAGQINPLIAQLAEAAIRARDARNALAEFNALQGLRVQTAAALTGAESDRADIQNRRTTAARDEAASIRQTQAATADARRDQILAVGSHEQQLALRQKEYDLAVKLHGADSAAAVQAQTALLREEQQRQRGAGGAGKLSAAQKLNNDLSTIQTQADQKSEDAELQHGQKLLQIERDYQQRSLEAQRANEVAKRSSRYSFYSAITAAEKDIGKQDADNLKAQYEQAFKESQALAQAGRQKEAGEYLQLRQRQLQDDVQVAQSIAQARKNHDDAEAQRLIALEGLRKDAQQEELSALNAAGDANVNQRNQAIADEEQRYSEATGKIATAADRAAERKITASERSTAQINTENLALARQGQLYDRLGKPGAGASLGAAPPAPPAPAGAAPPGATPDIWRVADADLLGAVQAQTAMQAGKYDAMIGRLAAIEQAVRSIRGVVT